jgi:hypothetical protein
MTFAEKGVFFFVVAKAIILDAQEPLSMILENSA